MITFESDYITGAHPVLMQRLQETNLEPMSGYGVDKYCESAKQKIREACACPDAQVEFIVGGTQTNLIVISTLLHDYEGVIAADTGHIATHEAGAIEYTGNKVIAIPQENGKIDAAVLRDYMETFYADRNAEHMVIPGMVYLSYPTEYGTIYSKAELTAISQVCRSYDIPLFMDGARLGYGLASRESDMTLADVAQLCDVFYIGGTKVGALCGEAVVYTRGNRPKHFVTSLKKRGGLLAKGRLLGVQFDALFTDGLYFQIAEHAIAMADKLQDAFERKGYRFFIDSPTNQKFVVLENAKMQELSEKVGLGFWEKFDDDHTVVRLATTWSTTQEDVDALEQLL